MNWAMKQLEGRNKGSSRDFHPWCYGYCLGHCCPSSWSLNTLSLCDFWFKFLIPRRERLMIGPLWVSCLPLDHAVLVRVTQLGSTLGVHVCVVRSFPPKKEKLWAACHCNWNLLESKHWHKSAYRILAIVMVGWAQSMTREKNQCQTIVLPLASYFFSMK